MKKKWKKKIFDRIRKIEKPVIFYYTVILLFLFITLKYKKNGHLFDFLIWLHHPFFILFLVSKKSALRFEIWLKQWSGSFQWQQMCPRRSTREQNDYKFVATYPKCGHKPDHITTILTTDITNHSPTYSYDNAFVSLLSSTVKLKLPIHHFSSPIINLLTIWA